MEYSFANNFIRAFSLSFSFFLFISLFLLGLVGIGDTGTNDHMDDQDLYRATAV